MGLATEYALIPRPGIVRAFFHYSRRLSGVSDDGVYDNDELMHHPRIKENAIYAADFEPLGPEKVEGDEENINKATSDVRDRFFAGAPMFKKKAIQDLDEQLRNLKDQDSSVYVKDAYDQLVRFKIKTGKVTSIPGFALDDSYERVL